MAFKSFSKTQQYLDRAKKSIPVASQTFSKSYYALPNKVCPLFLTKGEGCIVTDVDNNKFTDYVNGLLAVSLGYQDEDVDAAVIKQLKQGVSFSLPHVIETELAELLIELIPCAEKVRFGKNGSDATSAAVRLARAYTNKEHLAVCGYHGWQDWYIGATSRDLGIPASTKKLTHPFAYNDIASLKAVYEQCQGELAAVIMEPMNVSYPDANYLSDVRRFCDEHGIVLIFDETITGFRFDIGGAQSLFKVTPDLATFGKGMANGYPISAVVGRSDIMELMHDIFFSGTFGGETLSIAASIATIKKLQQKNVPNYLYQLGTKLQRGLNDIIAKHQLEEYFSVAGHPSWSFLNVKDGKNYPSIELKSLLLQELIENSILTLGSHNLSYSHTEQDIDNLLDIYASVLPLIKNVDVNQTMDEVFRGEYLQPVFKVR